MKLKKILSLTLALAAVTGALAGCGTKGEQEPVNAASLEETPEKADGADETAGAAEAGTREGESTKIVVGANLTPHAEILRQAQPILKEQGIDLEIVEIEDSVTPNTALQEGSIDANYFQHQPYLDDFNSQNGTDIISIGAIHYEPFGIYGGKTKNLSELPDGASVAVPNNVTNEARALLLLEQEGIITLKEGADIKATVNDIAENPKNITFTEVDPSQLVRTLDDVDIAVINGNYAIEGGLSAKDALAVESDQSVAAQTYANIIAVSAKDKDNAALQKLVEVLQSEEIKNYIEETYDGAVVPIG